MRVRRRVKRVSDSEVKGKEGFKKEGLVNSVSAAKDGRRGASTSRAGCALTLSWDAGRAVIRDPQAESAAKETSRWGWMGVDPPPNPRDKCPREP